MRDSEPGSSHRPGMVLFGGMALIATTIVVPDYFGRRRQEKPTASQFRPSSSRQVPSNR
jgi:hypothetical protein